jgi:hypothetical protein
MLHADTHKRKDAAAGQDGNYHIQRWPWATLGPHAFLRVLVPSRLAVFFSMSCGRGYARYGIHLPYAPSTQPSIVNIINLQVFAFTAKRAWKFDMRAIPRQCLEEAKFRLVRLTRPKKYSEGGEPETCLCLMAGQVASTS